MIGACADVGAGAGAGADVGAEAWPKAAPLQINAAAPISAARRNLFIVDLALRSRPVLRMTGGARL
jgi:hypothetical protein